MKASSGPRYVVGCRAKVDRTKLTPNTRVALDVTTLTIMRMLPREVRGAGPLRTVQCCKFDDNRRLRFVLNVCCPCRR